MAAPEYISDRIAQLRYQKKVSARDMSLSLGQSYNYINNIENKKSLPSMQMFLEICDYLGVTPKEFFSDEVASPAMLREAVEALKPLSHAQLELLIAIAKEMR